MDGTHPKRGSRSAPPATQWTRWKADSRPPLCLFSFLHFKNMFRFRRLLSPKFPRWDKTKQINVYFCHFLPWFDALLTLWGLEEPGSRGEWKPVWYIESIQKEPPPPILGWKKLSTPIIFRAIKIEKSSPTFGWKIFRKFFSGECFGGKGKPPILRRGGEVLRHERLVSCAKIVELFVNARG